MESIAFGSLAIAVAICVALTEVVKRVGLPTRFAPLVSIVIGVAWAFIVSVEAAIPTGIVWGLAASGLFDVGMKTVAGK